MKSILLKTIVIGATLSATLTQAALTLDLSSLPGSAIAFGGSSSDFTITDNGSGQQWWVTEENGGTGSALALYGMFTGGPWSYGPITVNGADQTATVTTTTGAFEITDASSLQATGNVNWVQVSTHDLGNGGVNADVTVNISGMAYSGLNADLQTLVASGQGSVDLSFSFSTSATLTDLSTGSGPYDTSYAGSLTAVPEPTTVIAGVLLLLPLAAGGLRAFRKNRAA